MVDHQVLDDTTRAALGAARRAPSPPRIVLLAPLGTTPAAPPSGADALLSKPVRQHVVSGCLRGVLGTGPAAMSPRTEADAAGNASRRVLLVEDNAVNRRVAEHQLRKLHCTVTVATNGVEAVDLALGGVWDIILMDCQMPLLDGFDATRRIRERESGGRRTPIIALTANALSGDRDICLAAGMDDYLTKPLDPLDLAACLQRWAPVRLSAAKPAPAATGSGHTALPIDLDALRETTDGDATFERELLDVFVRSGDAALAELLAALGRNDLPAVRRQAHAIKGASASLRATGLAARAQALESAAAVGDFTRCTEAAASLERDYLDTARFIAARRA
jgi:CheY-like chemotaxis protein/HPt (histidine-containing phosphotransfer) domain-containing protein